LQAFLSLQHVCKEFIVDRQHDPRRVSDRITAYALYVDPPFGRAVRNIDRNFVSRFSALLLDARHAYNLARNSFTVSFHR
jgi:predicted RNA methylase